MFYVSCLNLLDFQNITGNYFKILMIFCFLKRNSDDSGMGLQSKLDLGFHQTEVSSETSGLFYSKADWQYFREVNEQEKYVYYALHYFLPHRKINTFQSYGKLQKL